MGEFKGYKRAFPITGTSPCTYAPVAPMYIHYEVYHSSKVLADRIAFHMSSKKSGG